MKLLLWLTAAHVAQAAGRHGLMKKRQVVEAGVEEGIASAAKFEGLSLSYITETVTQKETETQMQTVLQTVAGATPVAAEAVTVTVNAPAVTVTETKTEVLNQVETQYVTQVQVETQYVTQLDTQTVTEVAPAPPAVTVTKPELVTVIDIQQLTVTVPGPGPEPVTITVAGPGPDPITIIQTVEAPRETDDGVGKKFNPGVTTIPIPQSSLPKTTLQADPFAPQGPIMTTAITPVPVDVPAPTNVVTPDNPIEKPVTTAVTSKQPVESVEKPATTQTPIPEEPVSTAEPSTVASSTQAEPVEAAPTMSPSMELGNMGPDTTGAIAAPALDGNKPTTTAGAGPLASKIPIDLSDPSKFSSVLDLGNLGGGGSGLKARATGTP
ncbi:hypothetical protein FGRMN_10895 [Fusarium graminum]|nr:hypothetical protein FGRMN_10895 [Fusarium graminum]